MRRSFRWLVTVAATAGAFSLSWWCCEVLLGLPRGDAIGIAAIPSSLVAAPLGWWAGRDLGGRTDRAANRSGQRSRDWPLVESVDPLLLGVHKARPEKGFDALPRYIPRDVDAHLHESMRTAARHGGFILLTGDSATGKSRTAFCAIHSTLAGYRVLSPTPGTDLRRLFTHVDNTSHRHILWLDDLEGHLASRGLQLDLLTDLLDQRVVVVATMRDEQYDRFRLHNARKAPHDENSRIQREMYLGAQVLTLATCIAISRKWSSAEIDRANSSDDPRLREALQRQDLYAIPEYVAAGPQLLQEWKQAVRAGGHPRGAALVAAAVDLNRAGLKGAISASAVTDLHHRYLEDNGGSLLRPEPLSEAMTWATTVRYGITSLLLPAGDNSWRAFDYLVDNCARDPDYHAVPEAVWRMAIRHARSARELHDIGVSAFTSQRTEIAEDALRASANQDDVLSMVTLGALLMNREATEEAEFWTRKAAVADHPAGKFNLAVLLTRKGEIDEAKSLYSASFAAGESDAAVNLGNILSDEGEAAQAVALYRKAADMGNAAGMYNLALHFRTSRDEERFEKYLRQACDVGHPMAMNTLGVTLMHRDSFDEAEHWLRQAATSLPAAQINLGLLMEKKEDYREAESHYLAADTKGDTRAALRLGDLLASLRRGDDAKEWWDIAAKAGDAEAASRRLVTIDEPNGLNWIITTDTTIRELGEHTIHEACRNLWPADCQTCGKPFGGRTPGLRVFDAFTNAYADLHHAACQSPAWTEGVRTVIDGLLTWGTAGFVWGIRVDGEPRPTPVFLVNPGLEQVSLTRSAHDSWQVTTLKRFEIYGFSPANATWPTPDEPAKPRTVPVSAHLSRNEIAVTVLPGTTWVSPVDNAFFHLARRLGGIYTLASTRINPTSPFSMRTLTTEVESGNIAIRWISFDV